MKERVLVTGGAGYIGSHVAVELLAAGYDVTVVDNLSTGSASALDRVRAVTGQPLGFVQADLRDEALLDTAFAAAPLAAVVHLAAMKSPLESLQKPLEYYDCNVHGGLCLLRAMTRHGVRRLVFSSTAAVYGDARFLPVTETHPCEPTHPYGRSKLMLEEIMRDLARSDGAWRMVALRYFNPIGAHPSGALGEAPVGIPQNLAPYILQAAAGARPHVDVFGDDYPTADGSGVRDFIHVVDLAQAHVAALRPRADLTGFRPINVGTGRGVSVFECIKAAERAIGRPVPFKVAPRRPGDIVESYADASLAAELLGWRSRRTIEDMWRDAWRWESSGRA
ncbi:MAG: UDP-glucose 4-epimerase GalE [Vicinamibacterales bacterium]